MTALRWPGARVALLLLAGPALLILPLWVCWCQPAETIDLATLHESDTELDLSGRTLVLAPGLPFGSDLAFASQAAHNFVAALREGNVYPRWVDSCNRGFGAPTFFFYPPLPYYAVGAASLVARDVVGAMRVVLAVGALAAALSFFAAARGMAPDPVVAVAAGLYVLAPYHVLDLYDRFAFASYLAFAWFPLLFLCVRRLLRRPSRAAWFGLAAGWAGLVATHLVSAYLLPFVLVPYAAVHVAATRQWRRLAPLAGAVTTGTLCVAAYLVPMVTHRDQVHLEWVADAPYGDWRRNFVYRDETDFGFRPAPIKPWVNAAATVQLLLSVAAMSVLWARRKRGDRDEADGRVRLEGTLFAALALWTFVLQTPVSSPVWAAVPELATVQFPWRFGPFHALATCFLLCAALSRPEASPVPARGRRRRRALLLGLAAVPGLLLSARLTFNRASVFDDTLAWDPVYYTRVMYEYIPRGVSRWQEFGQVPVGLPPATLVGPGQVEVTEWMTHSRRMRVVSSEPTRLRVRTFAFPGWTASLDGAPHPVDSDNAARTLAVNVPAGDHEIELRLEPTPDRIVGAALSFAGVATMLGFAAWPGLRSRFRRRPRPAPRSAASTGGGDGERA